MPLGIDTPCHGLRPGDPHCGHPCTHSLFLPPPSQLAPLQGVFSNMVHGKHGVYLTTGDTLGKAIPPSAPRRDVAPSADVNNTLDVGLGTPVRARKQYKKRGYSHPKAHRPIATTQQPIGAAVHKKHPPTHGSDNLGNPNNNPHHHAHLLPPCMVDNGMDCKVHRHTSQNILPEPQTRDGT